MFSGGSAVTVLEVILEVIIECLVEDEDRAGGCSTTAAVVVVVKEGRIPTWAKSDFTSSKIDRMCCNLSRTLHFTCNSKKLLYF